MIIQRQFQPDSAAMDDLVAVLYELLVEAPPETPNPPAPALPESTCFSSQPE